MDLLFAVHGNKHSALRVKPGLLVEDLEAVVSKQLFPVAVLEDAPVSDFFEDGEFCKRPQQKVLSYTILKQQQTSVRFADPANVFECLLDVRDVAESESAKDSVEVVVSQLGLCDVVQLEPCVYVLGSHQGCLLQNALQVVSHCDLTFQVVILVVLWDAHSDLEHLPLRHLYQELPHFGQLQSELVLVFVHGEDVPGVGLPDLLPELQGGEGGELPVLPEEVVVAVEGDGGGEPDREQSQLVHNRQPWQRYDINQMQFDAIPSQDYDWHAKSFINEGAYGQVFRVPKLSINELVAVKRMTKENFPDRESLMILMQEINIQRQLKHQNIMGLFEVFDNQHFCFIVMQLCDSSLRDILEKANYRLGVDQAINIFKQLMNGVKFMVDRDYIHRDVKPQNVLSKGATFKVSDFGFATKADISGRKKMTMCCGTPLYMAPQILQQRPYTSKCDIWSWGMLLYEIVFGRTPWPCRDQATYVRNMRTVPLKFPYQVPISPPLKDLISRCLTYDQDRRIGWAQFFKHQFFTSDHIAQQNVKLDSSNMQSLKKLSKAITKNGIDIKSVFEEFKKKTGKSEFDRQSFAFFCKKVQPSITSIEVNAMFTSLDKDKQGTISAQELIDLLHNYDFQAVDNKASRTVLELKQVIKNNNIDVKKLFDKIDYDDSGSINKQQFFKFIKVIAPGLRQFDSDQVFDYIDRNKSGTVEMKEFFQTFTSLSAQPSALHLSKRGKLILRGLIQTIKTFGIDIRQIMSFFDLDRNGLSFPQFMNMIRMVQPFADQEEMRQLFQYINNGPEGTISSDEILRVLNCN